ncbi:hypothetical protein KUTeg_002500 [Tegillarca granosa]|uniref:OCEL domain-containing protein n=1 Tax=Tegillarca granosa TaxID=220873 RepID=A0ABQ9FUH0_TEGGR|nr:hypothetical protein KUTeg_002500 [Tegillarca granosa]
MVHTRDENSGMSKYGILQMKWTTGVPCSMTRDYDDFSSKSGTCTPTTVASTMTARSSVSRLDGSKLPELQKGKKVSRSKIKPIRSDESVLPTIDSSGPYSPDFEWEHPLPPPPAKDSRTNVAYIKKQHDYYCKYYNLAKKNMQRDISISKYLRNIEVFDSLYTSYFRWKGRFSCNAYSHIDLCISLLYF